MKILETWSDKDLTTIGFDTAKGTINLSRKELRMLIDSLEDLYNTSIPPDLPTGETIPKNYTITEDQE